ncbi:MAG: aminopeptidase, partial [Candidatus Ornithospirochaeta sp.]
MDEKYIGYAVECTRELVSIDSPTGFTDRVASFVREKFISLGYRADFTKKGGVLVDLGGEDEEDGLLLMAHVDTIGAMVAECKANGRLRLTRLGGLHAPGLEGENVTVYTRSGKVYSGTIQLTNPSVHVADDFDKAERSWNTLECVLDEDVSDKAGLSALGIRNGDIVALDPKFTVTESGYIKSRFLDDKLSVGILFGLAKYIKDNNIL